MVINVVIAQEHTRDSGLDFIPYVSREVPALKCRATENNVPLGLRRAAFVLSPERASFFVARHFSAGNVNNGPVIT